MKPFFEKVLVANRGEIALRIMRTLKKMLIKSVAVYSEADTNAPHVCYAHEAWYIGNSPATESYLSIKNIVQAIRASGANAVHPGYGFLSENANFANILKREGVVLIGPSANAIKKMGDKIEAKKIAIEAGMSTVPGYVGIINNIHQAVSIAENIGFPVIIKAAAGGGGRGMRVVRNIDGIASAIESAKLEAVTNFNDSRLFIEKFIQSPRHIEIQVISDQYGNIICLGERECSIQRHHQKIIEEAPSSFITNDMRNKMYKEVCALVNAVGYYSAGTVEFIVSEDNFYFLEMNTRLQVEHPVTELITGIDIVELMIRIAAGEKLPFTQDDIKFNGWAIEARICAENPARAFLPSSGRITKYIEPQKGPHIRIDSGVTVGGEVSMFYDSMIAKICSYHDNRYKAVEVMRNALSTFIIHGVSHNISFLETILSHPRFINGDINTSFIAEEYPDGFVGKHLTQEITDIFLATIVFIHITEQRRALSISDASYVNKISTRWVASIDNIPFNVVIKPVVDGYNIRQGRSKIYVRSSWNLGNNLFRATINGNKVNIRIEKIVAAYKLTHVGVTVIAYMRLPRVSELGLWMINHDDDDKQTELRAPISGQVTKVKVTEGDNIVVGQELLILTAMKIDNILISEQNATVSKILVKESEHVQSGAILMTF